MPSDLGLPDSAVQLSFAVHELLGDVAAGAGLSVTQMRLLGILRDREPAMLELAAYLAIEKSSVTGLVDRAERRGLVARRPSERDARAVHVHLTAAGHELARELTAQVSRRMSELFEGLSARDRAQLSRLATKVVQLEAGRRGVDLRV